MDADELTSLLKPGHQQTLVHRLGQLNEAERKKLAPQLRKWMGWTFRDKFDRNSLRLAAFGCLGGVRQIATNVDFWDLDRALVPLAVQVLRDRSPHWLPALPEALLGVGRHSWWPTVRALVREGLIETPSVPDYLLGMVVGVKEFHEPVISALRRDPDLLSTEVWLLFSTEGAGRSLATCDAWDDKPHGYPGGSPVAPRAEHTWRHALVELSAEGAIDRGRLLDAALAASLRDWAPVDIAWFNRLHDALEPTLDEVASRQGVYARLLAVEHGPSIKLAQRQMTRLVKDPRLDPEPLVDASRATLGRSDKASVQAQLRLLAALAKARTGLDLADTVRVAADHPRADVREQAHKILADLGASVSADERQAPFAAPAPLPRPAPERVTPVKDVDELADLFLRLIEEADDPIEVERLLDGVLRMADERPAAADVLLRRCADPDGYAAELRLAIAALATVWLGPRGRRWTPAPRIPLGMADWRGHGADPRSLLGVAKSRLDAVAKAVRTGGVVGLALPSYTDGSIDPADLSERLASLGSVGRKQDPPAHEAEVAVLRVPPDRLTEVVVPRRGASAAVVARAIERVGERNPHWQRVTIEVSGRWQWEQPTRLVSFADAASQPRGDGPIDTLFSRARAFASARRDHDTGEYEARFEQSLAWCSLLLPHHPDLLAAHLHPVLVRDLGKDRGSTSSVHDALARSTRATMAPECSALVLGLGAKDALLRTAAQDAVLDLARHGLLDGAGLGRQAAVHLLERLVVGQRISKGLTELARDEVAVVPVLDALAQLVPVLPGRRDAGPFLELTADLADRTGRRIELPGEFRELAAGRSASMLAQSARRLL